MTSRAKMGFREVIDRVIDILGDGAGGRNLDIDISYNSAHKESTRVYIAYANFMGLEYVKYGYIFKGTPEELEDWIHERQTTC